VPINRNNNELEGGWKEVPKEGFGQRKRPKRRKREKGLPKMMDINEAHDIWGHKVIGLLRKTAKCYGVKLIDVLEPREQCWRANAKKRFLQDSNN
jgi:hypothetical protein